MSRVQETIDGKSDTLTCPSCGSGHIVWEEVPEVLLQDVECLMEET